MEIENLKKQIDNVSNLLDHELFNKIDVYKTPPGKRFQNDVKELMTIVNKINSYPILANFLNSILDEIPAEISKQLDIKQDEEVEIRSTEGSFNIITTVLDLLNIKDLTDLIQRIESELTIFVEAINSYFILALFSYLDYYSSSLYKLIITTYSEKRIEKLLLNYKPRGSIQSKLEKILVKLNLIKLTDFQKVLGKRTWQKTFHVLIQQRHILAHQEPKFKKHALITNFSKLYNKAKKTSK